MPALLLRLRGVAASDVPTNEMCASMLSPLARDDRERRNNLMATLRSYYECEARVDKTADAMFLHRNSVRYRLDRIRLLLQVDINNPATIAALTVALAVLADAQTREQADAG